MLRATACAIVLVFFAGNATAADKADKANKAQKNQMVRGTIKSVEIDKNVLIVNQKLKNETVQRELDISDSTVFIVGGKEIVGREGLQLKELKEGVTVQIKCDKDVKVLQVKVMGGKK